MIAVIFELLPYGGKHNDYFALAAQLGNELQHVDGFISIERFASLNQEGKFLSLSFWRDEASIRRWRNAVAHREAQKRGRTKILETYRLRVASVSRDYTKTERKSVPIDSAHYHGP